MTLDQFFERLPKDGWGICGGGILLRRKRDFACPVVAVCRKVHPEYTTDDEEHLGAGARLGLRESVCLNIACAADNELDDKPSLKRLRRRLLAHCGLTETPT